VKCALTAEKEKAQRIAAEYQKDLVHRLEVDRIATIEQQWHKNWMKTFLPPLSPPSDKEMNLLDYPPLTKRQRI